MEGRLNTRSIKYRGIGVLILLFGMLQLAVPAWSRNAILSNIEVTNTQDHLLVCFSVDNCFTEELNRAIESGLKTTFTFFVRLYEKKGHWWDKKIADLEVNHTIKYDQFKRIYEVHLSERENEIVTVTDYDEAKRLMSAVEMLQVTPLKLLHKGRLYKLQMMAELDKIRLPLYLHYVFFFLSLWDFETDWYVIDIIY
jgi:hypothetical protein